SDFLCFIGLGTFLVVVPAVVESGTEVQFCLSLLQLPEEQEFTVTVTLESGGERKTIYSHCVFSCFPGSGGGELGHPELGSGGAGETVNKKETRKIQIQNYGVKTFIQTDKPLYLPGQTGERQSG
uniref:Uncharacterized protein n=1 Tax=Neogobius melanostomus TaxID=47308 RepID=A0A8C6SEC6_9GOBI